MYYCIKKKRPVYTFVLLFWYGAVRVSVLRSWSVTTKNTCVGMFTETFPSFSSVALNSDATVLAAGDYTARGGRGAVTVFRFAGGGDYTCCSNNNTDANNKWTPMGNTIHGLGSLGFSLALDGVGMRLVVGLPSVNVGGNNKFHGSVHIYDYNADAGGGHSSRGHSPRGHSSRGHSSRGHWELVHAHVLSRRYDAPPTQDWFGFSVGISAAGDRVVAGAPLYSSSGGRAVILWSDNKRNTTAEGMNSKTGAWRVAKDIDGVEWQSANLGASTSISADGHAVAVSTGALGAPRWCTPATSVYYLSSEGEYMLRAHLPFGGSVCVSNRGRTLVVGSTENSRTAGEVAVYIWDNNSNYALFTRLQMPGKLTANDTGARFGHSVSTTADGKYVAVGAPGANANTGAVFVFNMAAECLQCLTGKGQKGRYFGNVVSLCSSPNNMVLVSADAANENSADAAADTALEMKQAGALPSVYVFCY